MAMDPDPDPVTCPMCEGAIPGNEIHTLKTCPSCGADLSALIRQRPATQHPGTPPPPQRSWLITRSAFLSILAPCVGIAVYLFGFETLSGSPVEKLVLGAVCSLFIVGGFMLGVVAIFAPKEEKNGTRRKAVAGICINGLLIAFAILSIFTRQKVAASGNNTGAPPRKGSSYISGK